MMMSEDAGPRGAQEVVVNMNDDDRDALARLCGETTAFDTQRLPARSLDDVIAKPWGWECRVFVDHLVDVWFLRIETGEQTSLHAHLTKQTHLLCLSGEGTVRTLRDEWAIAPGAIVNIARGAFHSTRATNAPLSLIEVEMPPNKLDLVRLEDADSRSTTLYETTSIASAASHLVAIPHLAGASIRGRSPDERFRFDLCKASELRQRSADGVAFYVPVGVQALRTRQSASTTGVLGGRDIGTHTGGDYLAIRPVAGGLEPDRKD